MHGKSRSKAAGSGGVMPWVIALVAAWGSLGAWPAALGQIAGDPPGRVARLSETTGAVWLLSPDSNEWVAVGRNRPLTTGDRLATDNDARAEISLGSTAVQLDVASELVVERLDDSVFRLRLEAGSAVSALRSAHALAEFSLVTDEGRFVAQALGRFRVDRQDEASDLTVLAGRASFENHNTALMLGAGQHAQFWLDAAGIAQYRTADPVRDTFAAWSDERDRIESQMPAIRYVSPEMTGAADLDRYGNWVQSAEDGPIWYPRDVAVDWVPYSTGHWSYLRPWGWTWVDAAPWGFAPFHYGRWVRRRDAWGWAPGTYVARPVYAPALVAWVGGGAGFGASLSPGRAGRPVGWFPLAPREVWVPGYRTSPIYVRNVNRPWLPDPGRIGRNVDDHGGAYDGHRFENRKFPHATTFVPASVLSGHEPVGPAAARFRADAQGRALLASSPAVGVVAAAPVPAPRPGTVPAGRSRPAPPFAGRPAVAEAGIAGEVENFRGARRGEELRRSVAVPGRSAPPYGSVRQAPLPGVVTQPVFEQNRSRRPIRPVQPIEPIRPMRANPIRPIAPVRPQDSNPIQPIQPLQPVQPLQPERPAIEPSGVFESSPDGRYRGRRRGPGEGLDARRPQPSVERPPPSPARSIDERRFSRPDAPTRMQRQDERINGDQQQRQRQR